MSNTVSLGEALAAVGNGSGWKNATSLFYSYLCHVGFTIKTLSTKKRHGTCICLPRHAKDAKLLF